MTWTTLRPWLHHHDAGGDRWDMRGEGVTEFSLVQFDLAARVVPAGTPGKWRVMAWPGPATNPQMQQQEFEGTLEEAKALAVALARLG